MAINFPNNPVGGTTYSYLGVTYTYKNTGSGTGFWQITGPGTYGLATTAEIDTGTDELKYVSPAGLEGSKYQTQAEVQAAILATTTLYFGGSQKLAVTTSGLSVTGAIVASDNITAYSDERLKKDIELIPDALSKVSQLRGVTFTDIATEEERTGLIAQDLQKVLPEAVMVHEGQEHLSVAYGNTVGLLVEAIKELTAKVEALEGGVK